MKKNYVTDCFGKKQGCEYPDCDCIEPIEKPLEQNDTNVALSDLEKPLEGEEKANYSTGLTDGALHGWNSAIDECVKVLKSKHSITGTLLDDINSLRK